MPRHASARECRTPQIEVVGIVPEPLRTEEVGYSEPADIAHSPGNLRVERIEAFGAQRDTKGVACVRPAPQLAPMEPVLEDTYAGRTEAVPVRTRPAGSPHAEPLPRDRVPVLQTGVRDVTHRHARVAGESLRDPIGIRAGLLDLQPVVLALAGEFDVQPLRDQEIFGSKPDPGTEQDGAQRTCAVRQVLCDRIQGFASAGTTS